MSTVITIATLALMTVPAPQATSTATSPGDTRAEALAVLKQADAAIKAVKTVRYRARGYGTEWLSEQVSHVEGTAVIGGQHERHFRVARFDTTVRFPFSDGMQKLTYGADGTYFFLIDWNDKLVYQDMDLGVTGHGGRAAQRIGLREFVHATPFDDEINADSVSLLDEKTIGSERCHVVDVVYRNQGGHAIWYFSIHDYLPRRVDRVVHSRTRGAAAAVVEILDLEANPEIADPFFTLSVPEGFEKSAGSAPDIRNRPW